MKAERQSALLGRWRIVEADLWDRGYLDMLDPAQITFAADGQGELSFGCVNASLSGEPEGEVVFFTWTGFDENDEVSGDGSAELLDDGTLEVEISFHNGDDAIFKARRL
jgi:hypothetical protein